MGRKFSTKKVYSVFFAKLDGFRPKAIFMKKIGKKYLLKHKCPMFKTSFASCIFQEHRYQRTYKRLSKYFGHWIFMLK